MAQPGVSGVYVWPLSLVPYTRTPPPLVMTTSLPSGRKARSVGSSWLTTRLSVKPGGRLTTCGLATAGAWPTPSSVSSIASRAANRTTADRPSRAAHRPAPINRPLEATYLVPTFRSFAAGPRPRPPQPSA